tara:strand:+ start:1341 stop:2129 length:789 start_codon:yes stop_codon:yes gene_type:complete
MKKFFLLLLVFTSLTTSSQDLFRETINGKIIVEGNDVEGIVIFNATTNLGTVSNAKGEFEIKVALNDLIEVKALEYKNFDLRINEYILESKRLSLFLIEEVNKLDEIIIVADNKMTGNLNADINIASKFIQKKDVMYFSIKPSAIDTRINEKPDDVITYENRLVDGLNIVNVVDQLLIPLFRAEVKDKKAAGIPEVPAEYVKYYLGSSFLVDNFKIPEHRVEEFIRYVEDDTFDFNLLNYGNEIKFLELLNEKSKTFLAEKK